MACLPLPSLPLPSLPGGISLTPPLPGVSFDARLCCKLLQFSAKPPPVALNIAIAPGVGTALAAALRGVKDYLNALPLDCPRE